MLSPAHKHLLLPLVLLLFFLNCPAQSYYFKHYQADDGLAHNTVVTIMQDSKGLMWLGTKGGLNRFDGYTFKYYQNKSNPFGSIGNNVILSLNEDQHGIIWIGTGRGIFNYNSYTEVFSELDLGYTANITHIIVDPQHDLWFLANGQLVHYDQHSHAIKATGIKGCVCMAFDTHMNIWLGHDNGSVTIYNAVKNTTRPIQIITDNVARNFKLVSKIYPVSDSLVLIGTTKQGLKSYNPATGNIQSLLQRNSDGTEIYVRDIVQSGAGEYWIATESGIYIYNTKNNTSLNLKKRAGDKYALTDNAVYSLCKDNQGGIWAGTFFGGLNYFSPENARFEKYYPLQHANSISGNAVREICSDGSNNIWIGTEDAGINKLDIRTGQFTNYTTNGQPTGLSYPNIHGLLAAGNRLYAGPFQHGLEILDLHSGRVIDRFKLVGEPGNMISDFVMSIYETRDSTLFIGTTGTGAGLYIYNTAKKTFSKCRLLPDDVYIYALFEDHEGIIWTGSLEHGTYWFNRKTGAHGNISFAKHGPGSTEHDFQVQGIFEDSDHCLWFATEGGGLVKLSADRTHFKKFTTQHGFPTNHIFRMLEDDHKNLWISSLKGLICLNPGTEQFKVYTQSNGLITDQFNYNAAFKDHSGKMYFGSVRGMIAFHPDQFTRSSYVPPIYITGFQVSNHEVTPDTVSSPLKRSILYTDSIILNHNQSNFSIEFAALNYACPDVTRYKYFMQGLDKDWTYLSSNRKAYFTDLKPGSYTFIVMAESNINSWTGKETRLFIQILPPFWKSQWAYVLYTVLMVLGLWLSIRYYHRYHANRTRNRLRLFEHQKEKEIYQAKIEFFTHIAHEIQTPLTLILGPLERLLKKTEDMPAIQKSLQMMNKSGKRLLELTSQLLDFRQTEVDQFGLNFVNADITHILEEQIAIFKPEADKAQIVIATEFLAGSLEAFVDREAFVKIVSNLISNAIKYAASNVTISMPSLKEGDTSFMIRFMNDGKGIPEEFRQKIFDPFFRVRSNEKPGTGIGLSLAKSLTELHNGSLALVSGETNRIIFELSLPVHQQFEFTLHKWKTIGHHEG